MFLDTKLMSFVKKIMTGSKQGRSATDVSSGKIDSDTNFVFFSMDGTNTTICSDGYKALRVCVVEGGSKFVGIAFDKIKHLDSISSIDELGDGLYRVNSLDSYTIVDDIKVSLDAYFKNRIEYMLNKKQRQENLFGEHEKHELGINSWTKDFENAIVRLGSYKKTIDKKIISCEGHYLNYTFEAVCLNPIQ